MRSEADPDSELWNIEVQNLYFYNMFYKGGKGYL